MITLLDSRMVDPTNPLALNSAIINDLITLGVSSDNGVFENLTTTGRVVTNFFIETTGTDVTFTEEDNAKVYHFDTSTTPAITATFLNTLPDGFNVALVNMGTGTIFIDSDPPIKAFSSENSTQYTGMFIYKANNEYFGVGVFE